MKNKLKFFIFGLFVAILIACSIPDGFDGLKWDTEFNIPLINNSYYAYELIDSEPENFTQLENGLMQFKYDTDLKSDTKIEQTDIELEGTGVTNVPVRPGQQIEFKIPLNDFQNSFEFIEALIQECMLNIGYSEVLPSNESFTLRFIEILTPDNNNLTITKACSNFDDSFDLTMHKALSVNSEILDSLTVELNCTGSLNQNPIGRLSVNFANMGFKQIKGKVFGKTLDVEESVTEIDTEYPDNLNNAIILQNAFAIMNFVNEIGFKIRLDGIIEAENEDGEKAYLDLSTLEQPVIIPAAIDYETPIQYEREIDITNLMNISPIKLTTKEVMLTVLEDEPGFAELEKGATGDMKGRVNFAFTFNNEAIRPSEIDSLEVSEDNQDTIEDYIGSAELKLKVLNGFPFAANAAIYFSTNQNTIYDQTENVSSEGFKVNSLRLNSGEVAVSENDLSISLSEDQTRLFASSKLYYGLELMFDENPNPVYVYAPDSLQVKGHIKLNVKIDTED